VLKLWQKVIRKEDRESWGGISWMRYDRYQRAGWLAFASWRCLLRKQASVLSHTAPSSQHTRHQSMSASSYVCNTIYRNGKKFLVWDDFITGLYIQGSRTTLTGTEKSATWLSNAAPKQLRVQIETLLSHSQAQWSVTSDNHQKGRQACDWKYEIHHFPLNFSWSVFH